MNRQILKEAFPKWAESGGIFSAMQNPPWESEIEGITLDIDYFGSRSGFKFCAPLVYNFLDSKGVVTDNGRTAIANVLLARFGKPWARLWNLLQSQYDPLNNYSVDETRDLKGTNKGKRTLNNETTDTGTRTLTDTGTLKRDIKGNDRTTRSGSNKTETKVEVDTLAENNYAGFNSPSYVQTDGTISTGGSTTTQTDTPGDESSTVSTGDTTDTHNLTNEEQRNLSGSSNGTQDDDFSTTDTGTVKREGVLGFISRQKLLEEERSAWQWDFFESVFADVDSVLALDIYDPCVLEQFDYTGGGGSSGSYVLPRATSNALGGVRAPAKTDGSVLVQVDAAGFLYVPPYPKAPEPTADIKFASTDKLGGIKLPSDPSGDGEEISTKNAMQYVVDKTLSTSGAYKDDDTVSVVIPYAREDGSHNEYAGLIIGATDYSPVEDVYSEFGDAKLYPVIFPYGYLMELHSGAGDVKNGVGYVVVPEGAGDTYEKIQATWDSSYREWDIPKLPQMGGMYQIDFGTGEVSGLMSEQYNRAVLIGKCYAVYKYAGSLDVADITGILIGPSSGPLPITMSFLWSSGVASMYAMRSASVYTYIHKSGEKYTNIPRPYSVYNVGPMLAFCQEDKYLGVMSYNTSNEQGFITIASRE